ncbi:MULTISPECIES: hypothetical protein [Haloferax]|uniref:CopG family transcriptional regulator n=1 Tax=Haloferax marinum TaxID=2666143 RepID=A0A6A8GCS9_9EURY|nr:MULTISPECIES: hypothetical protein [Haloferax]KAB1198661.1 hypothetical protein Hfx1150_14505 [Haloferax sp. CBA1150]MRW97776.1 hypothetical protein [Haloferax marinum]
MDGDAGVSLPEGLQEWVDERAEAQDVDSVTILARAINTYRLAVTDTGTSLDEIESVSDRLDSVEGRVDGLEGTVQEKIDDVRMRVVQVKRETDGKAPRDHDHPDLREGLDRATADIETLRDQLTEVESRVDAGFDNYEEILTYLDETTTDLDEHLGVVAQSLLNLRSRAADIEAAELERKALGDLLRLANDTGERKALCDDCGETVHLDLLTEPRCPACRSAFEDLSPSKGFFGSATLHTGNPPALEAATTERDDVSALFEERDTAELESEAEDAEGDVGNTIESDSDTDSAVHHEDQATHEATTGSKNDDD